VKQWKNKRVGPRFLTCNTSRVGGRAGALWDGTSTNSQAKVQDVINLHNQEKRVIGANQMEMCDKFSRDNLKHKFYTACNLWEEAPLPSL
jgi:hypothetical protein